MTPSERKNNEMHFDNPVAFIGSRKRRNDESTDHLLTKISPVGDGPVPGGSILGIAVRALLFLEKLIQLQLILRHHVFNEIEAAEYCRCSADSIRYHALRSRKLTFLKFSKEGLVFLKSDLDIFLDAARVEGFRDHS